MRVLVAPASGPFVGLGAAFVLAALLIWPLQLAADWPRWVQWATVIGASFSAGLSSFLASLRRDGKRVRLW